MVPPSTDVVRALGDLEGTVRNMAEQWRRQEDAAVTGRRSLHERMEGIAGQVTRLTTVTENVQQDVAELKNDIDEKVMPTVTAYKLDVARRDGALKFGRGLWAIILALCTSIGFAIHEAILYFNHGSGALSHIPGLIH